MLQKLQIRNFQAFEKFALEFDPNVTTIVGPSDVGKSSLIRTLCWVLTNRPRGKGFIRHGEKEAKARIQIDGHMVTRRRGSENTYALDEVAYTAFGNDVPPDVEKLFNISAANIQNQHDSPFWFCLSPGDLSKELNQIVSLSIIDDVLAEAASRSRKAKANLDVSEERSKRVTKELEDFPDVQKMEDELVYIENLDQKRSAEESRGSSLKSLLVNAIRSHSTQKRAAATILAATEPLEIGLEAIQATEKISTLEKLLSDAENYQIQKAKIIPDLSPLEDLVEQIQVKKIACQKLDDLLDLVDEQETKIKEFTAAAIAAEQQLLEESENICPTCLRPGLLGEK